MAKECFHVDGVNYRGHAKELHDAPRDTKKLSVPALANLTDGKDIDALGDDTFLDRLHQASDGSMLLARHPRLPADCPRMVFTGTQLHDCERSPRFLASTFPPVCFQMPSTRPRATRSRTVASTTRGA